MMMRLRSEHGFALPMALGVMLVLSISVAAVLAFSSSNARNSSLNERRQNAKALAEAGVNHGASVLAEQLSGDGSYSGSPSDTAMIQGSIVPWEATLISASPKIWLVSAEATLPNPTGPGAGDVSRRVEAQFKWEKTDPEPWRGLYIGNPAGRLFLSNESASIATDVYARGNLKITQGKYLGERLRVRGSLTIENSAQTSSIGAGARSTPDDPDLTKNACLNDTTWYLKVFPKPCIRAEHRVSQFAIKDGCAFSSTTPNHENCKYTSATGGASGKIWLTCPPSTPSNPCPSTVSPAYSNDPGEMLLYARAFRAAGQYDLGPDNPCSTQSGSPPAFDGSNVELMRSSDYSCKSANGKGELTWVASTNTLTVRGHIYFSRNLELKSERAGVFGDRPAGEEDAFIYVGQYVSLLPKTRLCGLLASGACDTNWDPFSARNLVTFVVGTGRDPAILIDGFSLQAGLETKGSLLLQNATSFKGPVIVEGAVQLQNSGTFDAWAPADSAANASDGTLTLVRGSWKG